MPKTLSQFIAEATEKCMVEIPVFNEDGSEKDRDYWFLCLQDKPCPCHSEGVKSTKQDSLE